MPQWNCTCPNCRDARSGRAKPRTQSCVAISDSARRWFLVNASPDLPAQLESHPDLQPSPDSPRNSPVSGVLLTNADLDHVLGLLLLREGHPLQVYATAAVRRTLEQSLGLTQVLSAFCGIVWHEPPANNFAPLVTRADTTSNLLYRSIPLPGTPPPFNQIAAGKETHSVAYQFYDARTNRRLLIAPDVAGITDSLLNALKESDAVLLDGTFWSADELTTVRPGARSAADMGHVTIRDGTLDLLAGLAARHKVYIHINNTNPVLAPGSPERAAVEAAGIVVGYDGFEFEL